METNYRDGEKIILVEGIFKLEYSQKSNIKKFIGSMSEQEHDGKNNILKLNITNDQKNEAIKVKNDIISDLKLFLNVENNQELIERLKEEEYIAITTHALQRLEQRVDSNKIEKEQSPFNKLKNLHLPSQSEEDLIYDAIEVFIVSNNVEVRIEYPPRDNETLKSYPRINYYKDMEKLRVCVEIKLEEDFSFSSSSIFLIITVITKDANL
ncbi:hypothetical protein KJB64_11810 [Staphylococcus cohnii]|uniref:hypothetical protein n=1 Tax=Staphylococcus cohnii TaxID=29382 RepID=UPI001F31EBBE|nr:hypothetical protein [Staphylococcus cohnii]MCE5034971.1 hypothetical protein [Staphylococcus cohnii]